MIVGRVRGATRNLGAPAGWERDVHGTCGGLPIRDEPHAPGLRRMVSAWLPTPREVDLIVAGAPVELLVIGDVHPPVWLQVGTPPSDPTKEGA